MEPPEPAMMRLERAIVRGIEPAEADVVEVDLEVSTMPGGTRVRARAHALLVGRLDPGAAVTIAFDPSRHASGSKGLVVSAHELAGAPDAQMLAGTPIVVAADPRSAEAAADAARVAGARDVRALIEPALGCWVRLLESTGGRACEVVVIAPSGADAAPAATGNALEGAALLGARPVAALTLEEADGPLRAPPASLEALRDHCPVGVHVAVPVIDEPAARTVLWNDLRAMRLEERHHLVEVDASVARAGSVVPARDLGASAAGILAGRMAVGGRRWRPPS